MNNCVFCKIVKGEIPCDKIYEDEDFLAFLSIEPLADGHTLVIPKKHFRWVWDLPLDRTEKPNIGNYQIVVAKIARHYQKVLNNEMVVSLIHGQDVPHAHIHLIPNPQYFSPLGQPQSKLTSERSKEIKNKFSLRRQ